MKRNDSLSTVNPNDEQTPDSFQSDTDRHSNIAADDVENGMGIEEGTLADHIEEKNEKTSYGHRIAHFMDTPGFAALMVAGGGTAVAFQAGILSKQLSRNMCNS